MADKKSRLSRLVDKLPYPNIREYKEDCLACNGRGMTYRKVDLHAPCYNCKSTGRVPFVDNVIPKEHPPNFDIVRQVAERNAHMLIQIIREDYAKLGIEVSIRLDFPNVNRGSISRHWEGRNLVNPTLMGDIYPADGNLEEKLIFEPPTGKEK